MAKQRANWLRSMGLVEKRDREHALTDEGHRFVGSAVEEWADTEWTTGDAADHSAGTYETVAHARAVDPEFRATVLSRYERTCPVSGVDHPGLLDVAHVLPWSEYPDYRADPSNVLALSKTHHAAFDRALFTIDRDYELRVNPEFETESDLLERTIVDRAGEPVSLPDGGVDPEYLERHNATLGWL
jgi:putative restriction endonuclease